MDAGRKGQVVSRGRQQVQSSTKSAVPATKLDTFQQSSQPALNILSPKAAWAHKKETAQALLEKPDTWTQLQETKKELATARDGSHPDLVRHAKDSQTYRQAAETKRNSVAKAETRYRQALAKKEALKKALAKAKSDGEAAKAAQPARQRQAAVPFSQSIKNLSDLPPSTRETVDQIDHHTAELVTDRHYSRKGNIAYREGELRKFDAQLRQILKDFPEGADKIEAYRKAKREYAQQSMDATQVRINNIVVPLEDQQRSNAKDIEDSKAILAGVKSRNLPYEPRPRKEVEDKLIGKLEAKATELQTIDFDELTPAVQKEFREHGNFGANAKLSITPEGISMQNGGAKLTADVRLYNGSVGVKSTGVETMGTKTEESTISTPEHGQKIVHRDSTNVTGKGVSRNRFNILGDGTKKIVQEFDSHDGKTQTDKTITHKPDGSSVTTKSEQGAHHVKDSWTIRNADRSTTNITKTDIQGGRNVTTKSETRNPKDNSYEKQSVQIILNPDENKDDIAGWGNDKLWFDPQSLRDALGENVKHGVKITDSESGVEVTDSKNRVKDKALKKDRQVSDYWESADGSRTLEGMGGKEKNRHFRYTKRTPEKTESAFFTRGSTDITKTIDTEENYTGYQTIQKRKKVEKTKDAAAAYYQKTGRLAPAFTVTTEKTVESAQIKDLELMLRGNKDFRRAHEAGAFEEFTKSLKGRNFTLKAIQSDGKMYSPKPKTVGKPFSSSQLIAVLDDGSSIMIARDDKGEMATQYRGPAEDQRTVINTFGKGDTESRKFELDAGSVASKLTTLPGAFKEVFKGGKVTRGLSRMDSALSPLNKGLGALSLIESSQDSLSALMSGDTERAASSAADAATDAGNLTYKSASARLAVAGKLMGHFGAAYQMAEGVDMYINGDVNRGGTRFYSGMGTALTLAGAGPPGWIMAVGAMGIDVVLDYKDENQIAVPHM
jgi:hypothetical protein